MLSFPLRVSVIVPVYNAARTLRASVASLLRQDLPAREMEILLVDDGSTDGSAALCDALAKQHRRIRVLHQPNGGVSAARNAGIRAARGACLLFLDADDTLEKNTVRHVVSFLEAHRSEVDVVTYPLYYVTRRGFRGAHPRNARFGATGVYPLAENPFLALVHMNVCVSNLGDDTPLFREDLALMEDQVFLTALLLRKRAVGFVREAGYCYLRHRDNATNALDGSFAIRMEAMRGFQADSLAQPEAASYLHALNLYDLDLMLRAGAMFPAEPGSEAWIAQRAEVSALLALMPLSLLLNYPFGEELHRMYFLRLKPGLSFSVEASKNALALRCDGQEIYRTESMDLALTRCRVEEDTLLLSGFLRSPLFDFTGKPSLSLADGSEVPLSPSPYGHWQAREETNLLWGFDLALPLSGPLELSFSFTLDGSRLPVTLSALPGTGFLPEQGQTELLRGGRLFSLEAETLTVRGADAMARKAYHRYLRGIHGQLLRGAPHLWAIHLMGRVLRRLPGTVWAYVAAPEGSGGEAQAAWRRDKASGVRRFFVGSEGIPFGSVRHLLLLLCSEAVLAERTDPAGYLPCAEVTFARFSDVWDFRLIPLGSR